MNVIVLNLTRGFLKNSEIGIGQRKYGSSRLAPMLDWLSLEWDGTSRAL